MYTGVIFAKQPSHVWESVFRTPLLCFLLSPTSHWEKVQNSTFVSIVDYWIMSTKRNRSKDALHMWFIYGLWRSAYVGGPWI